MTASLSSEGLGADLRRENDALLARWKGATASADAQPVIGFIERVAASGDDLVDARDRRAAQAMINYWAGELISASAVDEDWTAPDLAQPAATGEAPDPNAAGTSASQPAASVVAAARAGPPETAAALAPPFGAAASAVATSAASGARGQGELAQVLGAAIGHRLQSLSFRRPPPPTIVTDRASERTRKRVQIAATARRWKESQNDGWLLSGSALREAEAFEEDEDIGDLVRASRAKVRLRNIHRALVGLFCSALALALCDIAFFYINLREVNDRLHEAQGELERTNEVVKSRNDALAEQIAANDTLTKALRAAAQGQQGLDVERQAQIERLQAALRNAAPIVRSIGIDKIAELQPTLRAYVENPLVHLPLLPAGTALLGYNPDFLTRDLIVKASAPPVPMPRARGTSADPIPYINYSLVMAEDRHVPLVAAVNIRRSALIALQRVNAALQADPRVPADRQASPDWFRDGVMAGLLVNARDIAWGDGFPTNALEAGQRAYAMAAAYTNATPQFEAFDGGVWTQAESYARGIFAFGADRIIVFSGPVLAPDDPQTASGARVPRSFWKVLVAANADDPTTPKVEAYLIPQYDRDGTPVKPGTRFDPATMRVPISRLETLTGLDFGDLLRTADVGPDAAMPPNVTEAIADLRTIVAPEAAQRRAAVQRLLDTVRKPNLPDADRRRLVSVILDMARDESFASLVPPARVNLATLIATVPKDWWNAPGWIDIEAAARRAVGDAVATLGGCSEGGDACAQLAIAKQRLDWDVTANRIVYVQFAGMVRGDVQALSVRLRLLGWTLPGEDRTGDARGLDEVRFPKTSDEDRHAAELLAADYRILGQKAMKAVPNAIVKRGILEAWISL